jgi:hypothetical protein
MLYFNVYNDGVSGRSAMFLDDVHIWACPSAFISPLAGPAAPLQQMPEATPAPTATPQPSPAVSPAMTVLTVLTIEPATMTPPAPPPAVATLSALPPQIGPQTTPTPTPEPGALDRIGQALHLRPLPSFWPVGLLAILVVALLLLVLLR